MKSILNNYENILKLFHLIEEEATESEVATKVTGVLSKMQKHSFPFGDTMEMIYVGSQSLFQPSMMIFMFHIILSGNSKNFLGLFFL